MSLLSEYQTSACERCVNNSWVYNDDSVDKPCTVTCACKGTVAPKKECENFRPKHWYTRLQRWIGIFAYDHPAGFRCYDISKGDFLFWMLMLPILAFIIGGVVGVVSERELGRKVIDYNYVGVPDYEKTYYFEKEEYDWLMPILYKKAIFMDDEAAHTTLKLAPLKFEEY